MFDSLDFELDLEAKLAGAASAVTALDRAEAAFKDTKSALADLEKQLADTDKAFEKNVEAINDARTAMQRAMQEGDQKKFWKLAQTIDDLTKKEESLKKKSAELRGSIDAQSKTVVTAADRVGALKKKEDSAGKGAEALQKVGGPLGDMFRKLIPGIEGASGGLSSMVTGLGAAGTAALLGVAAVVALTAAFIALAAGVASAYISVARFAVETGNARHQQELTAVALVQSREAGRHLAEQYEKVSLATGVATDRLAAISKEAYGGMTAFQRAQLQGGRFDSVLAGLAKREAALGDTGGTSELIAQLNSGAISAERLSEILERKYGAIAREKMLGLDQQIGTLKSHLKHLFGLDDMKPFEIGLSRIVALFDQETESGKALKAIWGAIFGPLAKNADGVFVLIERGILMVEIKLLQFAIVVKKAAAFFREHWDAAATVLKGIGAIAAVLAVGVVAALTPMIITSGLVVAAFTAVAFAIGFLVEHVKDVGTAIMTAYNAGKEWVEKIAHFGTDMIDGIINGLSNGVARVEAKMKEIGGAAIKAMKTVLDAHSPSRVFEDIGLSMPQGLTRGVDAGAAGVGQAVDELVTAPPAPEAKQAQGGAQAGGLPTVHIEKIEINGVKGAEDLMSRFEDELVAILQRRNAQTAAGNP